MNVTSTAVKRDLADRPPSRGGIIDARSPIGRRRRELIRAFAADLGNNLTEGQRVDVRRAAELVALAEQARAKAMREGTGGAGALSVLVRLESTAARAVRALGLKSTAGTSAPAWRPSNGRLAASLAQGGASSG
jgi:hypothetical protein